MARREVAMKYGDPIPNGKPYRRIDTVGYVMLRWFVPPDTYVVVREHRLVAGLPDPKRFQVHHINGIKTDNRPENLQVVTAAEHRMLHSKFNLQEAISRYHAGESMSDIAKALDSHAGNVSRHLRKAGVVVRPTCGPTHHLARLTWEDVDAIRATRSNQKALARQYGVSVTTIQAVLYGQSYIDRRHQQITASSSHDKEVA